MCGIFGYIGERSAVNVVLEGLKRLEYRGYDSAGIAGIQDGKVVYCRRAGKVATLEKDIEQNHFNLNVAIAHTRWATHGQPNEANAHPQLDSRSTLALVHNGIIENYRKLREKLEAKGVIFHSETDTEVIAQLIGDYYEGDILKAVQKAVAELKGSFAVALIHQDTPDLIIAIAHESPLVIGIGANEAFISSDPHAFAGHTREVVFLSNAEVAVIGKNHLEVFNSETAPVQKTPESIDLTSEDISKGVYEHYTLKEIHEQPQAIRNALLGRLLEGYGTAQFEEFELPAVERILILGCGSSWHAGYIAAYLFEDLARIPVEVEISSEFRYKNPIVKPGTLVIAISQSGETADTLAAVRELKAKGAEVLALCNVRGSSLAREADYCLLLRAGPEIGVCSTKAFTTNVIVLQLLTLLLARRDHMERKEGIEFIEALKALPAQVQAVLDNSPHIAKIAKEYAHFENFFFLGRRTMFPTSLEGALKLKEISYINANGYPAGEMKHGPIALINPNCPTVALCADQLTYHKMVSNLREVKARSGPIIAIVQQGQQGLEGIADAIIEVPNTPDELAAIPSAVVTQLLAYYIAKERGTDIDQPRNLAKSVTVE